MLGFYLQYPDDAVYNTTNTNYAFHNPGYPANAFCDGLLDSSNLNDASVYAPLFAGQAAEHNTIELVKPSRWTSLVY